MAFTQKAQSNRRAKRRVRNISRVARDGARRGTKKLHDRAGRTRLVQWG
jgi:hypothetical protein